MNHRLRRFLCVSASASVLSALLSVTVSATAHAAASHAINVSSAPRTAPDRLLDPGQDLPAGWRTSADRVMTVAGDATGLHVLAADASTGYTWHTIATLGVRGTDTSQWIGQACLSGGGHRAVVVYAPRQITNTPDALGYGALAAVVNLSNGRLRQLGAGVSIAYFDPGCGVGQKAVLTQGGTGASPQPGNSSTRLMMLNTASGKISSMVNLAGQVTSAVPFDGGLAAVRGGSVVSVTSAGAVRTLAVVRGQAYGLAPDSSGGLGFLVARGKVVQVHKWTGGRDRLVGSAPLGTVELSQVGGHVYVTGPKASRLGRLPRGWRPLDVTAGADVSSTGMLAVSLASTGLYVKGSSPLAAAPDQPQPVRITAEITGSRESVVFGVPAPPMAAEPATPAKLPGFPDAALSGTTSVRRDAIGAPLGFDASPPPSNVNPAITTYDPDRSCSVPRNDPNIETYQPSAHQIEWAVDQAVQGTLTNTQPANLYGSGLPSYSPQGMFPPPGLSGGGTVPAQVMLGVLAQESAEDQASNHAIIAQTGNFMPSFNWYGDGGSIASGVHWGSSDCGTGIAQVTTGMCLSGYSTCSNPLPYDDQLAVAVDYEANIAAGLQILEQKWNQLYSLNIKANSGSPQYVEDWYFALWAYNSGLQPGSAANGNTTGCSPSPTCTDSQGNWGLGWVNNPANPAYPPDRPMFLAQGPSGSHFNYNWDEAHPAGWSYQEKVVGFGAYGFVGYNYVQATWGQTFAQTIYPNGSNPALANPLPPEFCSQASGTNDNCIPANAGTNAACQLSNSHCWWHWSITWTNCVTLCGTQSLTYPAGAANPGDPGVPAGYGPVCGSSPLPSTAVIVGNIASGIPAPLGCGAGWSTNGGTMTWTFGAASTTPATYPSKIDFHQIGDGYGGHYWFTHTIPSAQSNPGGNQTPQASNADLEITGTWTPPSTVTGWTKIMAAVPNEGAWDPETNYQINLGNGQVQYRVVNQAYQTDTWVSLGFFNLSNGANVSLTNVTWKGIGDDVAWDAMAFIPASAPAADYVALGDSYSSAEGLSPYGSNSDYNYAGMQDTCKRSSAQAYPDLVKLPGQTATIAQQAASASSNYQFAYLACSGALTPDITEKAIDTSGTYYTWDQAGYTQWTAKKEGTGGPTVSDALTGYSVASTSIELPQADQGWLSPTTTLVTITMGGNDARFPSVTSACMLTETNGTDCSATNYYLTQTTDTGGTATDPQPLYQFEPQVIAAVESHLVDSYAAMANAAPNARIVVLGYPRLFPGDQNPTNPCAVNATTTVPVPDMQMLNTFGDELDSSISQAVTQEKNLGVNIDYINPNPAFSGHELCSSVPWVNGIVNSETYNAGESVPGLNSFHLMAPGQQEYATLVDECLAGTLPSGDGSC